ncbi:MAG: peptide deformylase, partial [Gammaproteobacteria bacterium]|nr:peptide deformylase [Gammaproteobacteria bacterium]
MAVREVLEIGHPVLAARAQEVAEQDIPSAQVQSWIDDMIDTMRHANGAGIAANQIGIPHRIFVIEINDNPRYPYKPKVPLTVVINPQIEFLSAQTFVSNEGCLSVPQIRANVDRHVEIAVSYFNREGQKIEQEIRGYSACTWQHEYDHLDGILFPHRVTDLNSFCSWQSFRDYQQQDYAAEVE